MIIDSHVHIWVQQPAQYPWSPIGGYVPENEASVESLLAVMDANNIDGAVLVQPTPYGWNNQYLLDSAKIAPKRLHTVCLVNPNDRNSPTEMRNLVEQFGVNGFRFNWHLEPVEVWDRNTIHDELWSMASKLKSPICIQCNLDYLPLLQKIVNKFPEVQIVIDHIAKPVVSNGTKQQKFQTLLSLSQQPNIFIKLSGFYYSSSQVPPYSDIAPFVQDLIYNFGAHRCMWGSDFPFIQDRWNYPSYLNWFKSLEYISDDDRSWILGKTSNAVWW